MKARSVDWEGKIALGGFGNLRGIGDFYPIVSVDQYPLLIGIEAWKQLINKIRNPSLKVQRLIETEVIRKECIPDLTER